MENFAVDPTRAPYKPSVPVTVLADVVWLDEGHKRAFKGEIVKIDAMDAKFYLASGAVEAIEK